MACLPTYLKTILETRQTKYEAMLAKAYTYMDYLLGTEGIESGKFDSGESMSWWSYTNPADFRLKVLEPIERELDSIRNQLNGTGIVRLNQSRER